MAKKAANQKEATQKTKNIKLKDGDSPSGAAAEKRAAKREARGAKQSSSASSNARFIELSEKFESVKVQPYRMANVYPVETKIEHPKFGVGFVVNSLPDKIEVVFEDVSRQLVQGRK